MTWRGAARIHRLPDGSQEGNETGRMMEAQAGQQRQ